MTKQQYEYVPGRGVYTKEDACAVREYEEAKKKSSSASEKGEPPKLIKRTPAIPKIF